jgi:antagonist of KipI
MIEIISAGMLSTIQDLGRFGVMKDGFTQGGVMDAYSTRIANKLCGNDANAPVIEMTMLGITAKFTEEHIFAISGGRFDISLNNKPIITNKAYSAKAGDVLSIKAAKQGLRCYLAVAGGFDVPLFMGSASTNLKINVGGFDGRKLKAGDTVKVGKAYKLKNIEKRELAENTYDRIVKIRVVLGPQEDMFSENDLALFSNQRYTVTSDFDRMGIRLWGIALRGKEKLEIISDAITFGSIQITNSGMPIILMADHQTTGGYAKIATVISTDLPKLAQVKSNDKINFEIIDVDTAEKIANKQKKYIDRLF